MKLLHPQMDMAAKATKKHPATTRNRGAMMPRAPEVYSGVNTVVTQSEPRSIAKSSGHVRKSHM